MKKLIYSILIVFFLTCKVFASQPNSDTYPAIAFLTAETPDNKSGHAGTVTIVNYKGRIKYLTNAHVVKDREFFEYIKFKDGKVRNFKITKIDFKKDLALLELEYPVKTEALSLSPSPVKIGDKVFCVGFGHPDYQERTGRVFAFDKDHPWLLIDTEVVPGMSGGPVISKKGYLVGITWGSIYQDFSVDSAINLNTIKKFLDE